MKCYFCQTDLHPCNKIQQGAYVCTKCNPEIYHAFENDTVLILTVNKEGRYYDYFPEPGIIRFYDRNVNLMTHLDNMHVSSPQELEALGDRYFNLKAFV